MTIYEVASVTGCSVRTLHHYDKIGLLCPVRNAENNYRVYTDLDLDRLQQILFFKECGFALANIRNILESPSFNRAEAFALQRKYLLHERARLDTMLAVLDKSMDAAKGEIAMSQSEKFAGLSFEGNPYEEEARALWGNEAVDKNERHLAGLSAGERADVTAKMNALYAKLAALRGGAPDSEETQKLIHKMYGFFNNSFGIHYTIEAFAGLGRMYVEDERFTRNINKFGDGLAAFLMKAMEAYAVKASR